MSTIGFDTSNYTTSIGWTDGKNDINIRQILSVKEGMRGIRQSEGVFQHTKLVPSLFHQLSQDVDITSVKAVGISTRPRNIEGSYMPVFLVGDSYGRVVSDTLGVPLYEFSHQDGHVMAGIYSCNAFELLDCDFISVHLSGGTTEILKSRYEGFNFTHKIIGGTKDISAGQLIDRVGVKMGLHFPAGKSLEQMALEAQNSVKLPISVDGGYMNFSGSETKSFNLLQNTDKNSLALGILENVRDTLTKAVNNAINDTGIRKVLFVGGVASNTIIKAGLENKLNADVYFSSKEYSTDNAVGIAYLAYLANKEA